MSFDNIRSIHGEFADAVGISEEDRYVDRGEALDYNSEENYSDRFKAVINVFLCSATFDADFLKNEELYCIEDIAKLALIIIGNDNPNATTEDGKTFSNLRKRFLRVVKRYKNNEDYCRVVSKDEDECESLYGDLGMALRILEEWREDN